MIKTDNNSDNDKVKNSKINIQKGCNIHIAVRCITPFGRDPLGTGIRFSGLLKRLPPKKSASVPSG